MSAKKSKDFDGVPVTEKVLLELDEAIAYWHRMEHWTANDEESLEASEEVHRLRRMRDNAVDDIMKVWDRIVDKLAGDGGGELDS